MRISNRAQSKFLMLWHATFSGSFIVAYISEDIYAMHIFSGYLVLVCVAVRIITGVFARPKSPLSIQNPMKAFKFWIDRVSTGFKAKNPIPSLITLSILTIIGLSALSGAITDSFPVMEDAHEAISETILIFIFSHLAIMFFKIFKKDFLQITRPIYQHLTR